MHLENLSLTNFKNYRDIRLDLAKGLNCITGVNGAGKTNLLDAIYYLCLTKSAFNNVDSQLILHQEPFFVIAAQVVSEEETFALKMILQPPKKKHVSVNKVEYDKYSQHVGRFPVVMIAPNDTDLIREGSELRRKFFDNILSQSDPEYLQALLKYQKLIKQRNSLLKSFKETRRTNYELLDTYDDQILPLNKYIHEKRVILIEQFTSFSQKNYERLSSEKEATGLEYTSSVSQEDFRDQFKRNLDKDIILERTTMGVHKDDYVFTINSKPIKKFGSQGQQKSFVIAIKLAQHEYIHSIKSVYPLLLLDDIFDKLDDERIRNLVKMVSERNSSQIFITDARPERTKSFLAEITDDYKIIEIDNGELVTNE